MANCLNLKILLYIFIFLGHKYLEITSDGNMNSFATLQYSGKTLPWRVRCKNMNKPITRVGSIYIPGFDDTLPKPQSDKDLEIKLSRGIHKENHSIYLYTSTNSINRLLLKLLEVLTTNQKYFRNLQFKIMDDPSCKFLTFVSLTPFSVDCTRGFKQNLVVCAG